VLLREAEVDQVDEMLILRRVPAHHKVRLQVSLHLLA
jgi:hypothetical protein